MAAAPPLGRDIPADFPALRRRTDLGIRHPRLIRAAITGIVLCLSLAFFFRHAIANGFTTLYGASYDAVIETAILQHWYNVFTQGAAWNVTNYFYPHAGTLGYNDTYVIPGVFFTIGRLAGLDPFLATFASHVAMKAIGFAGMYLLLRRPLNVGHSVALFGAVLFTIAGATLLQMTHGQLLSLGLVPWLTYLLVRTLAALGNGPNRALVAAGSGLAALFALAAFNAFYFVWFFCFFLLLALPFYLGTQTRVERDIFFAAVQRRGLAVAAIAVAAALAMVPFLATYLPKLAESGGHSWIGVAGLLPTPGTILNVGPGNLLWGRLNEWLFPGQLLSTEDQVGFAPFTLAGVVAAALWARRHQNRTDARLVAALVSALLVAVLLSVKVGEVSLWRAVYAVVPGAPSVRAVTRFYLFALVPVTIILALWLDQLRTSGRAALSIAVMSILLLEQVQLTPPLYLDRVDQLRLLRSVPPPPTSCEAFFVVAARPATPERAAFPGASEAKHREYFGLYRHNVDAMLVASYHNRPTIIGFSSFNPPDWNFADPWKPDYHRRVSAYARRHHIRSVCGFDHAKSRHWFALQNPNQAVAE